MYFVVDFIQMFIKIKHVITNTIYKIIVHGLTIFQKKITSTSITSDDKDNDLHPACSVTRAMDRR